MSGRNSTPRALIGREAELAELSALLSDHRLVTVTGPGGVGKTSLALAAVSAVTPERPTEPMVCELAEVEDPAAVRHAVAARIGVQNPERPLGSYLPEPRDNSVTVIVLDNCEHVLDAAASVVDELLTAGPHLRLLATSREPLGFADEVVLRLAPLGVPHSEHDADAASTPAVALFSRHALAARRNFAVEPDSLVKTARICRMLDGLPLALEIAGARLRSFSLDDLAAQLDRQVNLTVSSRRGQPGRHSSLSAVVAWSYRLLSADEQRLFTRLCVHPAGFTSAAAVSAAAALRLPDTDAFDLLDGLVNKSLVALVETPVGARYRILEMLREFGLAQLKEDNELDAARNWHADYYAALVADLAAYGLRRWDEPLLALFWEFDNVRSALSWTIERDSTPDRTFDLLCAQWYVGLQESSAELAALCDAATHRWPDARSHPRFSEVMATASVCWLALGELDTARQRAQAAVDTATSPMGSAWALRTLAETSHHSDDVPAALRELDQADEAARRAGFETLRCDLLGLRVAILAQGRLFEDAWACAQRALEMSTAQSNVYEHAWELHEVGLLLAEADPVAAERWLSSALAESTTTHYPYGIRVSLRGLGVTATQQGRYAEAADRFLDAFDHFVRAGMRLQHPSSIAAVIPLLIRTGHRDEAVVAAAHLETTGAFLERISCPGFESARAELAPDLTAPDALARGRALTPEQVISMLRRPLRTLADGHAATTRTARRTPADGRPPAEAPVPCGALERHGGLWRVTYAGTTVHLPSLKGLEDLATLLARPGREVPALDLAALPSAPAARLPVDAVALGSTGDLGEVIDHSARAAYATRLRELQVELDDADAAGDAERASRAQEEFDALAAHLSAAYGLHGVRHAGDPAERARAAVTARLRAAIARIDELHGELGRHLSRAVRTGRFCCYDPDDLVEWTITP